MGCKSVCGSIDAFCQSPQPPRADYILNKTVPALPSTPTTRLSSDLVDVRTAVDCAIERLRDFDVFVKLDRWSDLTYCILLGRSPVSRLMLLILVHVLCIHPGRIIHLFDVQ